MIDDLFIFKNFKIEKYKEGENLVRLGDCNELL